MQWKKDSSQLCYNQVKVTVRSPRMIAADSELFKMNEVDSLQRN